MLDSTVAFLTENMKEMEIELRAQSIVLDALGAGIVEVRDLQDAMRMARKSEAMLAFVERKYEELKQTLPLTGNARSDQELAKMLDLPNDQSYTQ